MTDTFIYPLSKVSTFRPPLYIDKVFFMMEGDRVGPEYPMVALPSEYPRVE